MTDRSAAGRLVVVVVGLAVHAAVAAQAPDPAPILAAMRQALGGAAVLDGVRTWSVSGTQTMTRGGMSRLYSLELLALRPDHFMTIRRDSQPGGPMPIDITYYSGVRGDALIRRTDSTIPFPPDPGPQTPQAIADRERAMLISERQESARYTLALFGEASVAYPLTFSVAGTGAVDGRPVDVVEARAADGYVMRLLVDAATHLPAAIEWQAPPEVMMSVTSLVTVRGGRVTSDPSRPTVPAGDPTVGMPRVTRRLVFLDVRLEDGLNWPRRIRTTVDGQVLEDVRFGRFRINPKIDARRFDVGR